ncbi:hypothetical protein HanRHA438_Chr14g0632261 [Helianthus annuus]|nr:hypothetical protein HanIR_Chr14g0673511 [Helianthus annuus]KAJ0851913.1 hypothetical protein HanRHA438_Chr14g0632261 [Helianthus annuus]
MFAFWAPTCVSYNLEKTDTLSLFSCNLEKIKTLSPNFCSSTFELSLLNLARLTPIIAPSILTSLSFLIHQEGSLILDNLTKPNLFPALSVLKGTKTSSRLVRCSNALQRESREQDSGRLEMKNDVALRSLNSLLRKLFSRFASFLLITLCQLSSLKKRLSLNPIPKPRPMKEN